MATKSRSDDMQPRNFPNEKKHFGWGKTQSLVPKPISLPGVSLIVDKNQHTKVVQKKSFQKWKQQHEALFEPKHFRTTNQITGSVNQRKLVGHQQSIAAANPVFELDFQKMGSVHREKEHQHPAYDCDKLKTDFPVNAVRQPHFESMMTFSQLNRVARSEAINSNGPLVGQHNSSIQMEEHQSNPCGCQCVAVASNQTENNACESNQVIEPSMGKAVVSKIKLSNEALANIVEEQIEIVEQQKQILMQQNEIFKLQYQIEKLLLMNNGLKYASPNKQLQSSPDCKLSPIGKPNAMPIENGTSNPSSHTRKSVGVMTSLVGNSNEATSPDRNQNLQSHENGSPRDTMLERIEKIIQKSPPMINYKLNGGGNKNCRVSPLRSDVNISSQTLIYKTSTRNNISINDPQIADRSFALHLLDMKYNATETSGANRLSPRAQDANTKRRLLKSADDDFVPPTISPDKYDYLIRHGLLSK